MNEFIKPVINDKILSFCFASSFFLIFISLSYTFFVYQKLPPVIPIFNQLPWGEQRLGDKLQIFLPIIIAISINILNIFIASFNYKNIPLISRMFSVTSFLICLLMLIFIIRTVKIVI